MKRSLLLCGAVMCGAAAYGAELKLAPVFGDHMVLQRERQVPVWGSADAGAEVRVQVEGLKEAKTTADKEGNWKLTLEPLPVGGPYTLTASSGDAKMTMTDILSGDVWICSGQSNMEMNFAWGVQNGDAERAKAANYPKIRLLNVPNTIANVPRPSNSLNMAWQVCAPDTVNNFTAVGYFFGRDLNDALEIPIGLIDATWSGTIAETWVSGEKLRADCSEFTNTIDDMVAEGESGAGTFEEKVDAWLKRVDASSAATPPVFAADFDINALKEMPVPENWEKTVLPDFDGIVWIGRDIELPAELAGRPAKIHLEMIDDEDVTYFNGEKIGASAGWQTVRAYDIPKVRAGRNRIMVRVLDTGGGGGFHGEANKMKLVCNGQEFPLAGNWKFQEVRTNERFPSRPGPNRPTACYNGMIAPLEPLAIKGAIWYQGCSNIGRDDQYKRILPALIADWRARFSGGEFPFYIVQLSAFQQTHNEPINSGWAAMRWAQMQIGEWIVKNAGTAVTIDIGDHTDIHPKNKRDVGARLARLALHRTYAKANVREAGPIPQSAHLIADGVVKVEFKTDGALQSKDGAKIIKGFALAGADKNFVWASATVNGKAIDVYAEGIEAPRFVRYAWDDFPACDLTDEIGLPCGPFEYPVKPKAEW